MQRNSCIHELPSEAQYYYVNGLFYQAIEFYAQQPHSQQSEILTTFLLSFFSSLSGLQQNAHKLLHLAMSKTQGDAEAYESWGDFFYKFYCYDLASTAFSAAVNAINNSNGFLTQLITSMPARKVKPNLLFKAGQSALLSGNPKLAENFFQIGTGTVFHLGLAKLFLGEYTKPLFNGPIDGFEKKLLILLCEYHPRAKLFQAQLQKLSESVQDNPEEIARVNYFQALLSTHKSSQIETLLSILRNKQARWKERLLAGVALYEIDEKYLFEFIQVYETLTRGISVEKLNFEEYIYFLIGSSVAQREITKSLLHYSRYRFNITPPFAVPPYLRSAYIQILLYTSSWLRTPLSVEDTHQLERIKEQLICLVYQDANDTPFALDFKTAVNLAVQALCPQTLIGSVFAIPSGENQFRITQFLNSDLVLTCLTDKNNILSYSTLTALREQFKQNLEFLKPLKNKYPDLYSRLLNLGTEKYRFLGSIPEKDYSSYEVLMRRNAQNEVDWATTYIYLKKASDVGLKTYAIRALSLAKKGYFTAAKNEIKTLYSLALPHEFLLKLICEDFSDFFFYANSFKLAYFAYTFSPYGLGDKQLLNAGICASKVGHYDEAEAFFKRIKGPTIHDIYLIEANHARWIEREKQYSTNPNTLNKFTLSSISVSQAHPLEKEAETKGNFHLEREFHLTLLDHKRGKSNNAITERLQELKNQIDHLHRNLNRFSVSANILSQIHTTLSIILFSSADLLDKEEAFNHLNAAYAINHHPSILHLKIKFLLSMKKYAEAKIELDHLMTKNRTDHVVIYVILSLIELAKVQREVLDQLQRFLASIVLPRNLTAPVQCALAVAYSMTGEVKRVREILQDSNISPHIIGILEISPSMRNDYINLLLRSRNWPTNKLEHADTEDLKEIKEGYLEYIKQTQDLDLGLQAICPNTLIGKVFNIARGWFNPSFQHGSKFELLEILDAICANNTSKVILFDTHTFLLSYIQEDHKFMVIIQNKYPNLFNRILRCMELECSSLFFKPHRNITERPASVGKDEKQEQIHNSIFPL